MTDRFRLRSPLLPRATALYESGLPGLILRERDLADGPFEDMARHARRAADRTGALLLVTNRLAVAKAVAHGVHLGVGGATPAEARRFLGEAACIGVSLHRGDDPESAAYADADYFLYSPVFETVSKPGVPPVGRAALSEVCRASSRPVFALGGVTPERAAACLEAGAHGVATCGGFAGDDPPAETWLAWRRAVSPEMPASHA